MLVLLRASLHALVTVVLTSSLAWADTAPTTDELCGSAELAPTWDYWAAMAMGGKVLRDTDAGLCFQAYWGGVFVVPAADMAYERSSDPAGVGRASVILRLLDDWMMGQLFAESGDVDERILYQRQRVYALTGQQFESQQAAREWWRKHRCWLRLNPTTGQMLVDEEAMAKGEVVIDYLPQIRAREYWGGLALGELHVLGERGDYMVCEWAGSSAGLRKISKVPLAELRNEAAHQAAFLEVAERVVAELRRVKDPWDVRAARGQSEMLRRLTGEDLNTAEEWITWWDKHHENLRVSKDGEHLVADTWLNWLRGK